MNPSFIFNAAAALPAMIKREWCSQTILCHLLDDFIPTGEEASIQSFEGHIMATKPVRTWAVRDVLDAEDVTFESADELTLPSSSAMLPVHGAVLSAGSFPLLYIGSVNGFPTAISRKFRERTLTITWDNGPYKVADISDPAAMTKSALQR